MANPSENSRANENEPTAHQEIADKEYMKGLRPEEVRKIQKKETSIPKIKAERDRLAKKASIKLEEIKLQNTKANTLLQDGEELALLAKIRETKSPKDMEDLIKAIEGIPESKKDTEAKRQEEEKTLDPENEKLMEIESKFHTVCDKNKDLIGEGQMEAFKKHITEERKKNPTIAHMKEQLKRLEGIKSTDPNGLHPRRLEFHRQQFLFKKYNISSGPISNEYIKKQGLSERIKFRENAQDMEDKLKKMERLGIYSKKAIQDIMQQMLKAPTSERQISLLSKTTRVCNLESSGLTHLDSMMSVEGKTIRKMSTESKRKYFEFYADQDLDEREKLVTNWQTLVTHEAKLATDFAEVYKDHYKNNPSKIQENLHLALSDFERMDFLAKKDAIKDHKSMLEKESDADKTTRNLEIKVAHAKIDGEKTLSKKTRKNYKDWYNQKFDNDTSKLEDLKEANKQLTSTTPNDKMRNLAAYSARHKKYNDLLKVLRDIKPNMTDAEYEAYQDEFQEEGWEHREKLQISLEDEIVKATKEASELRSIKLKADIQDEDIDELDENATLEQCISKAKKLIEEGQAAEALKTLASFQKPDHPQIIKAMKAALAYLEAFGASEAANDNIEQETEKAMEDRLKSDKILQNDILEEQITTLNIEGTEQSKRKNDNMKSVEERAAKEAMGNTADTEEQEMIESFNQQKDDNYFLNEDLTGEKITQIEISETETSQEELNSLKKRTKDEQGNLINKEGILTGLQDKTGREVSTDEAKALQENNLSRIEEDLAHQSLEDVSNKKALGTKASDLTSHIAAHRKARSLIDDKIHRKIENTA